MQSPERPVLWTVQLRPHRRAPRSKCRRQNAQELYRCRSCIVAVGRTLRSCFVVKGKIAFRSHFGSSLRQLKPPPCVIKVPASCFDAIVGSTDASLSIFLCFIAHCMFRATRTWTSRINFGEIGQQELHTGIPRIACSICGPHRLRCHHRRPVLPRAERPPRALFCISWAWL